VEKLRKKPNIIEASKVVNLDHLRNRSMGERRAHLVTQRLFWIVPQKESDQSIKAGLTQATVRYRCRDFVTLYQEQNLGRLPIKALE
jgi:hypothetical protein